LRFLHHDVHSEVLVLENRIKLLKNPFRNFFTLIGLNLVNETLRITHHLLSISPSVVLLFTLEKD